MEKKFRNEVFYPADVEEATEGYCDSRVQQTWVARGMFLTRLAEPRAGKPRRFPLLAVYEAAILSSGIRYGLKLPVVQQAIRCRCQEAAGIEEGAVWGSEVRDAIYGLPEFTEADVKNPWFWGLIMEPGLIETHQRKRNGAFIGGVRAVKGKTALRDVIRGAQLVHLLNITRIVAQVDVALMRRLQERQ